MEPAPAPHLLCDMTESMEYGVWSKSTTPPVPYGWDKVDCMKAVWHSARDENESDFISSYVVRILLEEVEE